ncbi:MAG: hypothetical protein WCL00_09435 [Bacteroidota bacterium]
MSSHNFYKTLPYSQRQHSRYTSNDYYYRPTYSGGRHPDLKQMLITKFRENPKLKGFFIIALFASLTIVTALVILLFPLILKLLQYISANGLQGVFETIFKGLK